jgi:hypothetical protein
MHNQAIRRRSRRKPASSEPVGGPLAEDSDPNRIGQSDPGEDPDAGDDDPEELASPGEIHAELWETDPNSYNEDPDDWIARLFETGSGKPRTSPDWAVSKWMEWFPVVAVGRRPQDHMTRDLMHGSLLRNHRVPMFGRLAKAPPDWLRETVAHLPEDQQPQAWQHLALRMMHGRSLFHVTEVLPPARETKSVRSLLLLYGVT